MSGKAAAKAGAKGKAVAAAKEARVGAVANKARVFTKTHFYRPKTLTLARKPKYVRAVPRATEKRNKYSVIRSPLTTESAMKKIEDNNTLVFLADPKANKRQIKAAVKELYSVNVEKVNTLIRPDGIKKAYVKLTKDQDALDVANRLNII
jgi:large subunit ribosomal protein L23Ae